MDAELHYGGTVYRLAGGEERATEAIKEIRATIVSGGGTINLDTENGSINCVIGNSIPLAIVLVPAGVVFM